MLEWKLQAGGANSSPGSHKHSGGCAELTESSHQEFHPVYFRNALGVAGMSFLTSDRCLPTRI